MSEIFYLVEILDKVELGQSRVPEIIWRRFAIITTNDEDLANKKFDDYKKSAHGIPLRLFRMELKGTFWPHE